MGLLFKSGVIWFIFFTGVLIHKISHEKLPDTAGQISIRGSSLAVPGWKDNCVYLFKVNFA